MRSKLTRLAAALLCAATAGMAGAQTQGVGKDEIVIGTMQDLSGPLAGLSKPYRNGLQMRIDELNAAGGVHGRKVRLIVEDHGFDPKRAILSAQKLLNQDRVFLMLGHIGTPHNIAVMPLLFEKNVMNLFPVSPGRQMFDPVHPLKFAAFTTYYDQARQAVPALIKEKSLKKPCIIYQDDDFGTEHLKGVEDGLKTIGMQITERTSYKRGSTDLSSQVARMNRAGCDLVVLSTLIRETIATVSEARKTGYGRHHRDAHGRSALCRLRFRTDPAVGRALPREVRRGCGRALGVRLHQRRRLRHGRAQCRPDTHHGVAGEGDRVDEVRDRYFRQRRHDLQPHQAARLQQGPLRGDSQRALGHDV
jgi:hypothetical protein